VEPHRGEANGRETPARVPSPALQRRLLRLGVPAFYILFFGFQLALVATVRRRGDETFAFRMFSEASTIEPRVAIVHAAPNGTTFEVPLQGDEFAALVGRREFDRLGLRRVASYGAEVQRFRWRAAAGYLASHWGAFRSRPPANLLALASQTTAQAVVVRLTTSRNGRTDVLTEDRLPIGAAE
jgi:hypothetical protein